MALSSRPLYALLWFICVGLIACTNHGASAFRYSRPMFLVNIFTRTSVARRRRITKTTTCRKPPPPHHSRLGMISTGFSFDDGQQILVSIQKPMGILFEQGDDNEETDAAPAAPASAAPIIVRQVDPTGSAGRAGVQVGDVLVAVQNASVESADLDQVLEFIQKGPRVMNLRLVRGSTAS